MFALVLVAYALGTSSLRIQKTTWSRPVRSSEKEYQVPVVYSRAMSHFQTFGGSSYTPILIGV